MVLFGPGLVGLNVVLLGFYLVSVLYSENYRVFLGGWPDLCLVWLVLT